MLPVKKGALQTNRPQVAYKGLTGRCAVSGRWGEGRQMDCRLSGGIGWQIYMSMADGC
jgi:hypothetical protein